MKSFIPWVLVAVLLAGVYGLYASGRKKDEQIAQLTQETQEVSRLQTENEDLKKRVPQAEELARLRKENEELPKLRSTIQALRHNTADLTNQVQAVMRSEAQKEAQLTAQNENLRAQQAATQAAAQAAAQNQEASAQAVACIAHLRQLELAKQMWAQDHAKPPGSLPSPAELQPYFGQNPFPVCGNGGAYAINSVGVLATCSVPGHSLALANRYGVPAK